MTTRRAARAILALAAAGAAFAGYLSFYRLATGTCALSEPCPFFLGYPACWYGFGMFLALLALAAVASAKPGAWAAARRAVLAIAAVGIVFAGQYVVPEVGAWLWGGARYSLGLPSCAYGLVFYVAVFAVAWRGKEAGGGEGVHGTAEGV